MTAPTTSIVVTVPVAVAELVADRMWQWGVRGVAEIDVGDGNVEVSTSVGDEPDAIARAVGSLDPMWPCELRPVDATVSQVAPEFLSPTWYAPGLVCVPAAIDGPADGSADLVTTIDPGAAFGLGDHPTTRTSMALLARRLRGSADPASLRVLDVGCGTGALAVLAAQLGAGTIRALDIADAAVAATIHNAELNGVSGRIAVDTTPISEVSGDYDVVMANILAPTLISMAADLRRVVADGGSLFISGILADRHDHVLAALHPLLAVDSLELDGWITIELR